MVVLLIPGMARSNISQEEHALYMAWRRPVFVCLQCIQAAEGMAYLHDAPLLHRDLRSANILVSLDGNSKVCHCTALYYLNTCTLSILTAVLALMLSPLHKHRLNISLHHMSF